MHPISTPDYEQALNMAKIKTEQQQEGEPIVMEFEVEEVDVPTLVSKLKYIKGLTVQYYFGTEKALAILKKVR